MLCAWCRERPAAQGHGSRFCSRRCRQAAWRARGGKRAWRARLRSELERANAEPKRIAYADPPYPGTAVRYYRDEPTFRGEVDHAALVRELEGFDGWALSTSAKALRSILPLCPSSARVCAWVKPHGVPRASFGAHNAWEPVIVVPARRQPPGVRDWLSALPARGWGTLRGRKPIAFCRWLWELLGAEPGDEFSDLFPGTGMVARCWLELGAVARSADRDTSPLGPSATAVAPPAPADVSPLELGATGTGR